MNEIVAKIIEILQLNLPKNLIQHYFNGDPGEIASSYLPCCLVIPGGSTYRARYTGYDEVIYSVVVVISLDARRYFLKSPKEANGTKFLVDLMEGTTNGALNPNSILNLVRTKVRLEGVVIEGVTSSKVEYGFKPRGGDVFGLESQVVIEYKSRIQVNRS